MKIDEDFKKRLGIALKGESPHSFSKRAGISNTVLRRYLSGESVPGLDNLNSIADATNISVQWLATGREQTYSESFAERLNEIADKLGGSEVLAKETGINHDNMLDYLDGMRTPQAASVVNIARVGGVSLEWLLTGEGSYTELAKTNSVSSEWESWEEVAKRHSISTIDMFSGPMTGDHMHPTIRDGEQVLFSKDEKHLNARDGVFLIVIDKDVQVKRLQYLPGGKVMILSDNKAYASYELQKDDITIQGKAICVTARDI